MSSLGPLAQLRRASVGHNALQTIAIVCLVGSGVFWFVLYWLLLVQDRSVLQIAIALTMGTIYTLVLPLLWSVLVPTTPAGMLLQKTQHWTWGFAAIVTAALYLTYHAATLLRLWWLAQPAVAESGQDLFLTVSCLIAFVLVPALAWVQVTPEQWLAAVQQARQVRRLQIEQDAELAILKARLQWAEQRALLGYTRLLPEERQEVQATIRGLLMGIADSQRAIARTLGIHAHVERELGILDDATIAETLDYVARELEKPARQLARAIGEDDPAPISARSEPSPSFESHPVVEHRAPPRPAAPRRAPPRYAAEYATAFERLQPFVTARALARLLGVEERTARDVLAAWEQEGLITKGNIRGQWRWLTEPSEESAEDA